MGDRTWVPRCGASARLGLGRVTEPAGHYAAGRVARCRTLARWRAVSGAAKCGSRAGAFAKLDDAGKLRLHQRRKLLPKLLSLNARLLLGGLLFLLRGFQVPGLPGMQQRLRLRAVL